MGVRYEKQRKKVGVMEGAVYARNRRWVALTINLQHFSIVDAYFTWVALYDQVRIRRMYNISRHIRVLCLQGRCVVCCLLRCAWSIQCVLSGGEELSLSYLPIHGPWWRHRLSLQIVLFVNRMAEPLFTAYVHSPSNSSVGYPGADPDTLIDRKVDPASAYSLLSSLHDPLY